MLDILSNYPWTRLSVRIIGAIKRQFFPMVTHVFDNGNLSQEIFAIDTWRAVMYSFGHGRKHMLTTLPTIWRPGFRKKTITYENDHSCKQRMVIVIVLRLHIELNFGLAFFVFQKTFYGNSKYILYLLRCPAIRWKNR